MEISVWNRLHEKVCMEPSERVRAAKVCFAEVYAAKAEL